MSAAGPMRIAAIQNRKTEYQEQSTMRTQTIAVLGALALALGLGGPASASSFVDLTYDLSDTSLLNDPVDLSCVTPGQGTCVPRELLGASMQIRYTSDSASSMPILPGPAALQSLALQAHLSWGVTYAGGTTPDYGDAFYVFFTANMNLHLVSPVSGSLLSGGTLTFSGAGLRVTGSQRCVDPLGRCPLLGAITSLPAPLGPFTTTARLSFAASPGPHGGAQSTRHTVSGTIPAYVPTKVAELGLTDIYFLTGVSIVGREILREADGHDPKITPEPGTLLLLGAGTAGLALVGSATRRSGH